MASKDQPAPVPPPDPAALIQLQQGANLSAANLTGNLAMRITWETAE